MEARLSMLEVKLKKVLTGARAFTFLHKETSASAQSSDDSAMQSSDPGSSESSEPTQQVGRYLDRHGYGSDIYQELTDILSERVAKPGVKKQPIHALGIEYPVGEAPKINVYVTPLL